MAGRRGPHPNRAEQFVAVLGHDLRNPLAGIDAGIGMLRRHGLDARTPEILEHMRRSVGRMHELINNVLDLTRSRLGGGIALQIEGASIGPILTQIIEELQIVHSEREIVVVLDTTEPVDCDEGRIGQLLSNLLGNALHHGPKDAPVRVDAVAKDGRFTLSVANAVTESQPRSGIGCFNRSTGAKAGQVRRGWGWGFILHRRLRARISANSP